MYAHTRIHIHTQTTPEFVARTVSLKKCWFLYHNIVTHMFIKSLSHFGIILSSGSSSSTGGGYGQVSGLVDGVGHTLSSVGQGAKRVLASVVPAAAAGGASAARLGCLFLHVCL